MSKDFDKISAYFNGGAKELFLDVAKQRVLGASAHNKLIGEMFNYLAEEGEKNKEAQEETRRKIRETGEFFISTRGKASSAVTNGIRKMLSLMSKGGEFRSSVAPAISKYIESNQADVDRVCREAQSIVSGMESVMLFDYSSTVNRCFILEAERGHVMKLYIPESRILDGGMPYIKNLTKTGHELFFVPDSAIAYFLKKCGGAFIGAETYFPDGTVFNTTGSEMVAELCRCYNTPFYVLTPLIKLDIRAFDIGWKREDVMDDLSHKLMQGGEDMPDCFCPELVGVEPESITALVTEEGLIRPKDLYDVAVRIKQSLEA